MLIRIFNEKGLQHLKSVYIDIKEGRKPNIPDYLLTSDSYSSLAKGSIDISYKKYSEKEDLAKYLSKRVDLLQEDSIMYNVGLWSWLSAFFFNVLCPFKKGKRKVNSIDRHILNKADWRRYYRHLLACPVRLYQELGETSKIYLSGPPDVHGDLLEQLAATQEIATNPGIIEAATILYWDEENEEIKRGSRSDTRLGNVRRFARDVIPQFQLTYDLNTMSGQQIVQLLPNEFEEWKT